MQVRIIQQYYSSRTTLRKIQNSEVMKHK